MFALFAARTLELSRRSCGMAAHTVSGKACVIGRGWRPGRAAEVTVFARHRRRDVLDWIFNGFRQTRAMTGYTRSRGLN